MKVKDGLAAAGPDVDDDPVIVETRLACRVRDELEHLLRLIGGELADIAKRLDVTLRNDEQVRLRARVDVRERDESVAAADVVPFPVEPAEETVRQTPTIPSSVTAFARARTSSPTRASPSISHGE